MKNSILKKLIFIQISLFVTGVVFFVSFNFFAYNQKEKDNYKNTISEIKKELAPLKENLQSYKILGLSNAINSTLQKVERKFKGVVLEISTSKKDPSSSMVLDFDDDHFIYAFVKTNNVSYFANLKDQGMLSLLTLLIFLLFLTAISSYFVKIKIFRPLKRLENLLKNFEFEKFDTIDAEGEIRYLINNLQHYYQKSLKSKAENQKYEITRQVAHDIRSPLAALDMLTSQTTGLPEDQRNILRNASRRIHDIADNLLTSNVNETFNSTNKQSTHLISGMIAPLMAEKRAQFRDKIDLTIEAEFNSNNYGLFADVNIVEFKRVLSNLINNAAEATPTPTFIKVNVYSKGNQTHISISDNGPGIPAKLLPELTKKGATFGKKGGSGLGLYHAKESIELWGGELQISSKVGSGTTVTIVLPKSDGPKWFLPKLEFSSSRDVVIFDDDSSIHQVWKSVLAPLKLCEHGIKTYHFTCPEELRKWYKNKDESKSYQYLFDYEILENHTSGLDLIEELEIKENAILVTSHYEEIEIQERCLKNGMSLLPKNLVIYIPKLIKDDLTQEAVLIDDDALIRKIWEIKAKEKGINLKTYPSIEGFSKILSTLYAGTPIYIDSNLKDERPGEDFAKELSENGFENLYLATGYEKERFENLDYLKGVIGKTPPWT